MNLVLGASGRLGQALCRALAPTDVRAVPRTVYDSWADTAHAPALRDLLIAARPTTIFMAAGVIDPGADAALHQRINFALPVQLMRAALPLGIRVLSFGSAMEVLVRERPATGYVASKMALAEQVAHWAAEGAPVMHLRLHTLYGGGPPAPFMFAGQMLQALRTGQPFRMSPGTQLREYHHVDDEAAAVVRLAGSARRGVFDLSHGQPVPLAALARHVFSAFGAEALLQIGALPAPPNEHFGRRFMPLPEVHGNDFREACAGLIEDLRLFL